MKFLHTSDWHIGRTFHGQDLLGDQEQVLGSIADLVVEHGVDAVLIAGDLYDRAVPSTDAVQCATRILRRIGATGATIVISSGNHDSAPRLGAFADFLEAGGLHIRSEMARIADPVVLDAPSDDPAEHPRPAVLVYAIPYLEPDVARQYFGLPDARSHQRVLTEAMRRVRADLATRPAGTRAVVVAHAFVVGGVAGDTERSIAVGGVESVTADVFDGIDYVALGHLHGRQVLADHLRYSGSPMPYSFTEAGHTKSVWLVDLGADGLGEVTPIDLPVARPLATVRGELAEVLVSHPELREHYLAVEMTDDTRPTEPMRRLREVFPFALKVEWKPAHPVPDGPDFSSARRETAEDVVIAEFIRNSRGIEADATELGWVSEALSAIRQSEAAL
ncbi:exonuclease SbcCD subunit D [Nakamurella silvestris]|nr:exonuclease SbcCD subunit D [Nakamurella silvestris]